MPSMRITPRHFHFFASLFLCGMCVYFQAFVFSRFENVWLNFDLITIIVFYTAVEHHLFGAFLRISFLAVLLHSISAVPDGFYLMYYLIVLVAASLISRMLVIHNLLSQFISFAALFALKFILLYFVMRSSVRTLSFIDWFLLVSPGFLSTTLVSLPVFAALSEFDRLFEFGAVRNRKQEIADSL